MSDALRQVGQLAAEGLDWATTRTVRIGVTGLARAGKTAFLTSTAANLLALGAGRPVLPALARRLAGRPFSVRVAPAGAAPVPRFDVAAHLRAFAQDPPDWPARTDAASLLALDVSIGRAGLLSPLPPQRLRLELLDYPGEWLLDLPLLRTGFDTWSEATLRRLDPQPQAAEFLAFANALPHAAPADEALAATGHRLYVLALERLRDAGFALLQPGRFLMPAPGPLPAWIPFFPHRGAGGLHALLDRRYAAYTRSVRDALSDPLFGRLDRMVVLVDLLTALARGPAAFHDTGAALAEAAGSLRWTRSLLDSAWALARLEAPPRTLSRVVFAATKADHVGARQRANLAALLRHVAAPAVPVPASYLPLAAVRSTEDTVLRRGEGAFSAVTGRQRGETRAQAFHPGEVPSDPPDAAFWSAPFLRLPDFEPGRPADAGRGGIPNIGLDAVLLALLEDLL